MTNREPLQQPHAQKEKPDGLQTAGPLTDRTDHVRNGGDYTGNCAAKQEQEPVAWKVEVEIANHQGQSEYRTILAFRPDPRLANGTYIVNEVLSATPLYTAPQRREWVKLDRKEMLAIIDQQGAHKQTGLPMFYRDQCLDMARAIEAKLKEKNEF